MILEAIAYLSIFLIAFGFFSIYPPLGYISLGSMLLIVCALSLRALASGSKDQKKS